MFPARQLGGFEKLTNVNLALSREVPKELFLGDCVYTSGPDTKVTQEPNADKHTRSLRAYPRGIQ